MQQDYENMIFKTIDDMINDINPDNIIIARL
jgi:hypothetical protein